MFEFTSQFCRTRLPAPSIPPLAQPYPILVHLPKFRDGFTGVPAFDVETTQN